MSLPSEDNISRFCKASYVNQDSGKPTGAAFLRTVKNGKLEDYLSVNWLEKLSNQPEQIQIDLLKQVFINKGFTLKKTASFAVLNVGDSVEIARSNGFEIDIFHDERKNDESHSSISNMPAQGEDIALAELIAKKVIRLYQAQ